MRQDIISPSKITRNLSLLDTEEGGNYLTTILNNELVVSPTKPVTEDNSNVDVTFRFEKKDFDHMHDFIETDNEAFGNLLSTEFKFARYIDDNDANVHVHVCHDHEDKVNGINIISVPSNTDVVNTYSRAPNSNINVVNVRTCTSKSTCNFGKFPDNNNMTRESTYSTNYIDTDSDIDGSSNSNNIRHCTKNVDVNVVNNRTSANFHMHNYKRSHRDRSSIASHSLPSFDYSCNDIDRDMATSIDFQSRIAHRSQLHNRSIVYGQPQVQYENVDSLREMNYRSASSADLKGKGYCYTNCNRGDVNSSLSRSSTPAFQKSDHHMHSTSNPSTPDLYNYNMEEAPIECISRNHLSNSVPTTPTSSRDVDIDSFSKDQEKCIHDKKKESISINSTCTDVKFDCEMKLKEKFRRNVFHLKSVKSSPLKKNGKSKSTYIINKQLKCNFCG
eukprot:Awhi_evm2s2794